jgi:hypothetical protein
MTKWIELTVFVVTLAVVTLGCTRGPMAATAVAEPKTSMLAPAADKTSIATGEATALWRDISIYRDGNPRRLAGPTYPVSSYATKAECDAAMQAAVAKMAEGRAGPATEPLPDGLKTWDSDRLHYTTFRYLCGVSSAGPPRFR